jgi:Tfp pilus assembly protein PilN
MRPVNLIPAEDRSDQKGTRTGPVVYVVLGTMLAVLAGVVVLVLSGNQISQRKDELARLQQQATAAKAAASRLASYSSFSQVRDARLAAVSSLADSRFDWQRVMHELSLVLPPDVWLTNLTGTVRPGVSLNEGSSSSLRGSAAGPALEISGCATSQEAVAGFISDLKDIDGVTRVGVQSSSVGSSSATGGGAGGAGSSSSSSGGDCQTRASIVQFQMVATFDAAPVAPDPLSAGSAAAAAPAPSSDSSGSASGSSSSTTPPAGSGSTPAPSSSSSSATATPASNTAASGTGG